MLLSNNHIRKQIIIQEGNYKPKSYDKVKAVIQGDNYVDVVHMKNKVLTHVKRIDKDRYIDLLTGEIKFYNHKEPNETRDYHVLQRTFKSLRQLIRHNYKGNESEVFITLTYQSNMQDTKKLYKDFKLFMQALNRHYKQYELDYITVAEPQDRGAWHFHIIMKCQAGLNLWFNQSVLKRLWNNACKEPGSARIERLKSNDVGSYYVAYFTDTISAVAKDGTSEEKSKARIKGGRLSWYPKSFKFFRCSRGIKKPNETEIILCELENDYELVYERSIEIISQTVNDNPVIEEKVTADSKQLNKIYKATYKRNECATETAHQSFDKEIEVPEEMILKAIEYKQMRLGVTQ